MSTSLIGRTLGNYKIIDSLGQGGMATVYVGYQEAVDRKVAIKVLPPHPGLNAGFVERFQLEAKTIANLQHPHILPLYDYGNVDDILYLAMAYVDGGSVEDRLKQGELTIREAEKIIREIAGALDYAHRRGVIHRDIKPANILLSSEGYALLADFGIAKLTEGTQNLTGTGVIGTPAYMAPEAAQGLPLDHRADIYSLGVLAYQMLTGEQPITAPSMMQLMLKVIQEPPRDILEVNPDLPEEIKPVFDTVLAKAANERYQTAIEFAEALSAALHNTTELKAIRAAVPLSNQTPEPPTIQFSQTNIPKKASVSHTQPASTMQTKPDTVIIRQGLNPNVLIGAAVIIIIAVLGLVAVLSGAGDNDPAPSTDEPGVISLPTASGAPTLDGSIAAQQGPPALGRVNYNSVNGIGDAVAVRVDDLRRPEARQGYTAWLVNTDTGDVLKIGNLNVDAFGSGALVFTDAEGRTLPAYYNALYLTLEADDDATTPNTDIIYSSAVPFALTEVLHELFVASPDGVNGGSLFDAMRQEADFATQHAGFASNSTNAPEMHSHAEHTINILRGTEEDHDGNGRGENPGRGIGIYDVADIIDSRLADAIADAPVRVQSEAGLIRTCLQNTRLRADRVIELEFIMLASDSIEAVQSDAQEAEQIAAQIINGFDLNDNGVIEPFEGECGLAQIEIYGLLSATMDIREGAPE